MPTRRRFIQSSGSTLLGASALGVAPRLAFGADEKQDGPNKPTLVVIYLRGGSDPLNTIVPYGDERYYRDRPTIAIPKEADGDTQGVIKLDDQFGLHPAMLAFHRLYQAGNAAAILNVGSTHPTRSHFDAQDFMERAAPGIKTIAEGWLNRYLYATRTPSDPYLRGVALQPLLPRSLRGQYPVLAVPGAGSDRAMAAFEALYGCTEQQALMQQRQRLGEQGVVRPPLPMKKIEKPDDRVTGKETKQEIVTTGTNTIRQLRELREIVAQPGGDAYQRGPVHRQLRDIAKVIKANRGLEVAAVDYNGWDHHSYQGGVDADGAMSGMLREVASAIETFVKDLGEERMKRVCVLTMTEFGRRVKENGNHGTDHGHGGYMLAVGGMVKGGKLYGKWTGLEPPTLDRGRDLPVHTDFRLVFSEVLANLFGFDTAKHKLFPEYEPESKALGFMRKV